MTEKLKLSPKAKKIINIVVDVFVAIVLLFAFILAIFAINSKTKGYDQYTEIMGKAYLAVQSDSMKGDKKDNFEKGDLIVIKTVDINEARKFEVGQIITFKTREVTNDDKMVLNTHRIIEVVGNQGEASAYVTHGDNVAQGNNERVLVSDVVGVFETKESGIGHMFLFMSSSTGFFVCIVLPTLLVVAYAAVNLVLVILKEKKVQSAAAEEEKESEREKMRAELMAEMGIAPEQVQKPAEPEEAEPVDKAEPVEEQKAEEAEKEQSDAEVKEQTEQENK